MRSRVGEWTAKLLLLCCSSLLALGALELLARYELERPRRGKGFGGPGHMRFHPLLGWEKTPGAVDDYDRDEFKVRVRINSQGLRDVERDLAARDAFRVLALGDSFLEAYTVELEQALTRQLEARLARRGCPIEVVNAGTSGYGTDQEWLYFREQGRLYGPRLVLLFFHSNDLDSNLRAQYFGAPKPLVEPGPHGLAPVNAPLSPPQARRPATEEPEAAETAPGGSALWAFAQRRMLRGAPRAYARLAALGLWPAVRPEQPSPVYRVYFVPPGPRVTRAWLRTEKLLEALRDDVRAAQARLAVVYIPNKIEVRQRDFDLTSASYAVAGARFERDVVRTRLAQVAERLSLPFLDLTEALRAKESWLSGSTYLERDGHWTARGHAVAAETVAGWLRGRQDLPACASDPRPLSGRP